MKKKIKKKKVDAEKHYCLKGLPCNTREGIPKELWCTNCIKAGR